MATLRTVEFGPTAPLYGSLEAAEASVDGSSDISALTGSDEWVQFRGEDFSDTVSAGFSTGWVTQGPDNYVEVLPKAGAKHDGRARDVSGTGLELTNSANHCLRAADPCNHFRVTGVVLRQSSTSSTFSALTLAGGSWASGANDVRITDCILHDKEAAIDVNYVCDITVGNLRVTFENTIMYGRHRSIDGRQPAFIDIKSGVYFGPSILGPILDSTCTTNNSYSGGHTDEDWWDGGSSPSGFNNASADITATVDYTDSINSLAAADQFINASIGTSADFRLKSGSDLEGAGLGGVSTLDIVGTVRDVSTPDIGAFEFVGGGGPTGNPRPLTLLGVG